LASILAAGAQSRDVLGAYFPSWMLCVLIALVVTVAVRWIFIRVGVERSLPAPVVVYLALTTVFSPRRLAVVAELNGHLAKWRGRILAIGALVAVVLLTLFALFRLDRRPRSQDAFVYADSTAIAPEVSDPRMKSSPARRSVRT
jgi:Ca2+/Na+ antiporter